MTLLENTNVSTAALRRARVARMRAATPGLDADQTVCCAKPSHRLPRVVSRGVARHDWRHCRHVARRAEPARVECGGNEATRRLLQAAGAAPLADVEIVLLPSAAVLKSYGADVEATPDLLRLGVKSFVPEPTQRSNSTLVFWVKYRRRRHAVCAPVPTTPPQTPAPTPSKVVPRDNGPEWALVGSTVLSSVAVAGAIFAQSCGTPGASRVRGCFEVCALVS